MVCIKASAVIGAGVLAGALLCAGPANADGTDANSPCGGAQTADCEAL